MTDFRPAGDDTRKYQEFELSPVQRESVNQIKHYLQHGYESQKQLREHINFLEGLVAEIRSILHEETGRGYQNATLEHDYRKARNLLEQLSRVLDDMDR